MTRWQKILENDDFIVEFDKNERVYRVTYFGNCHYEDEVVFKEYVEEEDHND